MGKRKSRAKRKALAKARAESYGLYRLGVVTPEQEARREADRLAAARALGQHRKDLPRPANVIGRAMARQAATDAPRIAPQPPVAPGSGVDVWRDEK